MAWRKNFTKIFNYLRGGDVCPPLALTGVTWLLPRLVNYKIDRVRLTKPHERHLDTLLRQKAIA